MSTAARPKPARPSGPHSRSISPPRRSSPARCGCAVSGVPSSSILSGSTTAPGASECAPPSQRRWPPIRRGRRSSAGPGSAISSWCGRGGFGRSPRRCWRSRPTAALAKPLLTVAFEALRAVRREARAQPGRRWRLSRRRRCRRGIRRRCGRRRCARSKSASGMASRSRPIRASARPLSNRPAVTISARQ